MGMTGFDEKSIATQLEKFLKEKLTESRLNGYVIGLSGGIDSSLSATIAMNAVGADNLFGILMPYSKSSENSQDDAQKLADDLKIKAKTVDISPMIDVYYENIELIDPVRSGNKMARERMSILFDNAFDMNRLVLGTSNRTEICLGYGTWHGDVACSVNPLGMLYKTYLRQLARHYGIPESILNKTPSADLWPGQTDEEELGLEYEKADRLLYMLIEDGVTERAKLNAAGFEDVFIDRAVSLLNKFYFKRHLPEIADLGFKAIPDKIQII